jgi:hypothetical protein
VIDSVVISLNEYTKKYTMTIMNYRSETAIQTYTKDSIEEILDILDLEGRGCNQVQEQR